MGAISAYAKQVEKEIYQRGFKHCINCNQYRPIGAFGKHIGHKFNLTHLCKECRNLLEICKKHKLKLEQLKAIYKKYKNMCGICNKIPAKNDDSLAIDHDHKTGIIRGLLCDNCNIGLGHFKDNIELLQNACVYLKGELQ